jgi:drug/metabolite transporter (DMT)-like permease
MGALIALLAVSGSFLMLAAASTLARLIVYSICIASLPKHERPTSLVWVMMAAGVAVCAWAAIRNTNPNYSTGELWSVLAGLVAVGTLLYAAARFSARRGRVSSIQPPPSTLDPS